MKKQDKRIKRAKLKAKKLRVEKHYSGQRYIETNIVEISHHLIHFFKTLPDFTSDLECVPLIRNFIEQQSVKSETEHIINHVAGVLAMYGCWFHTGKNVIEQRALVGLIDFFYEDDVFIEQLNR